MVLQGGLAVVLRPTAPLAQGFLGPIVLLHTNGLQASDVHKASEFMQRKITQGVSQKGASDPRLSGDMPSGYRAGRVTVMNHTLAVVYRLVAKILVLVVAPAQSAPALSQRLATQVGRLLVATAGTPEHVTFQKLLPEYHTLYLGVSQLVGAQAGFPKSHESVAAAIAPTLTLWHSKDGVDGKRKKKPDSKADKKKGALDAAEAPVVDTVHEVHPAKRRGLKADAAGLSAFRCLLPLDPVPQRAAPPAPVASAEPDGGLLGLDGAQDALDATRITAESLDELFQDTSKAVEDPFGGDLLGDITAVPEAAEEEAAAAGPDSDTAPSSSAASSSAPEDPGAFPLVMHLCETWVGAVQGRTLRSAGLAGRVWVDTEAASVAVGARPDGDMPDIRMRLLPPAGRAWGSGGERGAMLQRALRNARVPGDGLVEMVECPDGQAMVMRPEHAEGMEVGDDGRAQLLHYALPAVGVPAPLQVGLDARALPVTDARLRGRSVAVLTVQIAAAPHLRSDLAGVVDFSLPSKCTVWGAVPKEPRPLRALNGRLRFAVGPVPPGECTKVEVLLAMDTLSGKDALLTAAGRLSAATAAVLRDAAVEVRVWGRPGVTLTGVQLAEAESDVDVDWQQSAAQQSMQCVVTATL